MCSVLHTLKATPFLNAVTAVGMLLEMVKQKHLDAKLQMML